MTTSKRKKKVSFYLDDGTQSAIEKIPSFYRSSIIRDLIRIAESEGRLDIMVRNTIGPATVTSAPKATPDAASPVSTAPPPAPPIQPPVQQSVANSEEIRVEVEPPPPDRIEDEYDELDADDPTNYEAASAEESPATPPLEIVSPVPVEETPVAAKEAEKDGKPVRRFRNLQDMIESQIKF